MYLSHQKKQEVKSRLNQAKTEIGYALATIEKDAEYITVRWNILKAKGLIRESSLLMLQEYFEYCLRNESNKEKLLKEVHTILRLRDKL